MQYFRRWKTSSRIITSNQKKYVLKKILKKDKHFENISIPDTEEESVENNAGSGTDFFVAYSVVPETEEEEN